MNLNEMENKVENYIYCKMSILNDLISSKLYNTALKLSSEGNFIKNKYIFIFFRYNNYII